MSFAYVAAPATPTVNMAPLMLAFVLGLLLGAVVGAAVYALRNQRSDPPQLQPAPTPEYAARQGKELEILRSSVEKLSSQVRDLNEESVVTQSTLVAQVQAVTRASTRLGDRTDQLVSALRSPNVRGRWGEMQLERVVELGGMKKYCDFDVQATAHVDGHTLRPDMVIRLSGGRNIIVDAKVPFSAYLDALATNDPEEKAGYLRRHCHLLRSHVDTLSSKSYVSAFQPTPEFIVLFIPSDPFLDAALEQEPQLLDHAFAKNIVLATPATLFALLKTVALGWQQEDMSDKAVEVQRLGAELYARLGKMAEHYNRVGASLDKAVDAFNATLGSMDSRVMVTARRLRDLDLPAKSSLPPQKLQSVSARARVIHKTEEPPR
ncbi:DNA recombination protein RmuC [Corynebacterium sp. MSK044]|uniref:DNA recombination protein RmuC n=1 Tax=Corynebacterium sp. MSK044 TaxID=3050195 RepID=UPI0025517BCE|nr:DNA recombination protein RmuC [Corynebacterium sp. MSK044]MDK8797258.1 DNA recombination protein RmuC [Corynebacterium sp. MSK044]